MPTTHTEKAVMDTLIHIASKKKQYLGVNLTKEWEGPLHKNLNPQKKDMETLENRNIPHVCGLNTVKNDNSTKSYL